MELGKREPALDINPRWSPESEIQRWSRNITRQLKDLDDAIKASTPKTTFTQEASAWVDQTALAYTRLIIAMSGKTLVSNYDRVQALRLLEDQIQFRKNNTLEESDILLSILDEIKKRKQLLQKQIANIHSYNPQKPSYCYTDLPYDETTERKFQVEAVQMATQAKLPYPEFYGQPNRFTQETAEILNLQAEYQILNALRERIEPVVATTIPEGYDEKRIALVKKLAEKIDEPETPKKGCGCLLFRFGDLLKRTLGIQKTAEQPKIQLPEKYFAESDIQKRYELVVQTGKEIGLVVYVRKMGIVWNNNRIEIQKDIPHSSEIKAFQRIAEFSRLKYHETQELWKIHKTQLNDILREGTVEDLTVWLSFALDLTAERIAAQEFCLYPQVEHMLQAKEEIKNLLLTMPGRTKTIRQRAILFAAPTPAKANRYRVNLNVLLGALLDHEPKDTKALKNKAQRYRSSENRKLMALAEFYQEVADSDARSEFDYYHRLLRENEPVLLTQEVTEAVLTNEEVEQFVKQAVPYFYTGKDALAHPALCLMVQKAWRRGFAGSTEKWQRNDNRYQKTLESYFSRMAEMMGEFSKSGAMLITERVESYPLVVSALWAYRFDEIYQEKRASFLLPGLCEFVNLTGIPLDEAEKSTNTLYFSMLTTDQDFQGFGFGLTTYANDFLFGVLGASNQIIQSVRQFCSNTKNGVVRISNVVFTEKRNQKYRTYTYEVDYRRIINSTAKVVEKILNNIFDLIAFRSINLRAVRRLYTILFEARNLLPKYAVPIIVGIEPDDKVKASAGNTPPWRAIIIVSDNKFYQEHIQPTLERQIDEASYDNMRYLKAGKYEYDPNKSIQEQENPEFVRKYPLLAAACRTAFIMRNSLVPGNGIQVPILKADETIPIWMFMDDPFIERGMKIAMLNAKIGTITHGLLSVLTQEQAK